VSGSGAPARLIVRAVGSLATVPRPSNGPVTVGLGTVARR
jgi:hypothetical protein